MDILARTNDEALSSLATELKLEGRVDFITLKGGKGDSKKFQFVWVKPAAHPLNPPHDDMDLILSQTEVIAGLDEEAKRRLKDQAAARLHAAANPPKIDKFLERVR
jgi:hypothetical protein